MAQGASRLAALYANRRRAQCLSQMSCPPPGLDDAGGLYWLGPIESCDLCHEIYPLSWIEFNGTQFLCLACRTEERSQPPLPLAETAIAKAGSLGR